MFFMPSFVFLVFDCLSRFCHVEVFVCLGSVIVSMEVFGLRDSGPKI